MTGGKFSLQKVYWVERNRTWVAVKNFPWILLCLLPFVTVIRYVNQGRYLLRGDGDLHKFREEDGFRTVFFIYVKAFMDVFRKLPVMITRRRELVKRNQIKMMSKLRLIWRFHLSSGEILGVTDPT
jgi:hypothetical protein